MLQYAFVPLLCALFTVLRLYILLYAFVHFCMLLYAFINAFKCFIGLLEEEYQHEMMLALCLTGFCFAEASKTLEKPKCFQVLAINLRYK